jgi:serine/threonine protein kinase
VQIYEVGEHQGQHYYYMPLVGGGNLAQHLPRLRGDLRAVARLLAAAARAVHHAHQRGILHCNLKPSNILLNFWSERQRFSDCELYVSDFRPVTRPFGARDLLATIYHVLGINRLNRRLPLSRGSAPGLVVVH